MRWNRGVESATAAPARLGIVTACSHSSMTAPDRSRAVNRMTRLPGASVSTSLPRTPAVGATLTVRSGSTAFRVEGSSTCMPIATGAPADSAGSQVMVMSVRPSAPRVKPYHAAAMPRLFARAASAYASETPGTGARRSAAAAAIALASGAQ